MLVININMKTLLTAKVLYFSQKISHNKLIQKGKTTLKVIKICLSILLPYTVKTIYPKFKLSSKDSFKAKGIIQL